MIAQAEAAERFRALHEGDEPLLMPNPWDVGSARIMASLGFRALATTSSGFAATLGHRDYGITRDEALAHARSITAAGDVPVSADLEDCFGERPEEVAETARGARDAGLAGFSIEDHTKREDAPIHDRALAVERVAAAAEIAHGGAASMVLTARAENHLHGRDDLDDTIARLIAYRDAGADVLFAPGLTDLGQIEQLVTAVDRPVNVLLRPNGPTVAELASVGVKRISVGGAFAFVALGAMVEAGRALLDDGTAAFWERAALGFAASRDAFS